MKYFCTRNLQNGHHTLSFLFPLLTPTVLCCVNNRERMKVTVATKRKGCITVVRTEQWATQLGKNVGQNSLEIFLQPPVLLDPNSLCSSSCPLLFFLEALSFKSLKIYYRGWLNYFLIFTSPYLLILLTETVNEFIFFP